MMGAQVTPSRNRRSIPADRLAAILLGHSTDVESGNVPREFTAQALRNLARDIGDGSLTIR